jgi:hypothetical protein
VSEQIAELAGSESQIADARRALAAVARAEARASIEAAGEAADAATRERLREVLEEVDLKR